MSLDVYLELPGERRNSVEPFDEEGDTVYSANITHNLGRMADEAGIYRYLWRPDEIGIKRASELIIPLAAGLNKLITNPTEYKQYNPINGWGDYEDLVRFVKGYLDACRKWPNAAVRVWR